MNSTSKVSPDGFVAEKTTPFEMCFANDSYVIMACFMTSVIDEASVATLRLSKRDSVRSGRAILTLFEFVLDMFPLRPRELAE